MDGQKLKGTPTALRCLPSSDLGGKGRKPYQLTICFYPVTMLVREDVPRALRNATNRVPILQALRRSKDRHPVTNPLHSLVGGYDI